MAVEFIVSDIIPATPAEVYAAWLSSEDHAEMTGGGAEASDEVGGAFFAWDGYISGKNILLEPDARIVQSWRTTEFADEEPDSRLEIILEPADGGTMITLKHANLPAHGMQYADGWKDHYFTPMKDYFGS